MCLGNHQLLKEKLLSIPEHISNIHHFPTNSQHRTCCHPPLTGERSKAWLNKDSLVLFHSSILQNDTNIFRKLRKLEVQFWVKITVG